MNKRGRPRIAPEVQAATITLPTDVYDECCREALARGVSLAMVLRDAIKNRPRSFSAGTFQYTK